MVEIRDKEHYFNLIKDFEFIPFTQTRGWYDYNASIKPDSIRCFVDNESQPKIACFGHEKRFLGLKMLLIEGECVRQLPHNSKIVKPFFDGLKELGYDLVEMDSYSVYESEYEIGARQSGFLRPVGMFSIHLSSWIDLSKPLIFNDNWKRNLKLARNANISFRIVEHPTRQDAEIYSSLNQQLADDKDINSSLTTNQIEIITSSENFGLAFVENESSEVISAIIFHTINRHSGLLYAAKSAKAKECGATFFMYEQLLTQLATKGYATFDMERLLPSTHSTNGVFLFKQGIRGEHVHYNGEWSWYKRAYLRPAIYFVKRFLMKRIEV